MADEGIAYSRGHPYRWDRARGGFIWTDTGEDVDFSVPYGKRECYACGEPPNDAGHDPCIADLLGVAYACCGHGRPLGLPGCMPYVTLLEGGALRADAALAFFASQQRRVGEGWQTRKRRQANRTLALVASRTNDIRELTAAQHDAIREARLWGVPFRAIAAYAGVSHETIRRIINSD